MYGLAWATALICALAGIACAGLFAALQRSRQQAACLLFRVVGRRGRWTVGLAPALSVGVVTTPPTARTAPAKGLRNGLTYGFSTKEYGFHGERPIFGFLLAHLLPFVALRGTSSIVRTTAALCVFGVALWTHLNPSFCQSLLKHAWTRPTRVHSSARIRRP